MVSTARIKVPMLIEWRIPYSWTMGIRIAEYTKDDFVIIAFISKKLFSTIDYREDKKK